MITRAVLFTGHRFIINGNDHMEGHDAILQRELGNGVAHVYNKRGGTMYVMFPGDPTESEILELVNKIEKLCEFEYIDSIEEQYQPQFETHLKFLFGDKLIIK